MNLTPRQVAIESSLLISMFAFVVVLFLEFYFQANLPLYFNIGFPLGTLLVSYFTYYYSLEKFIYERIKLIYKSIYEIKTKPQKNIKQSSNIIEEVEREVDNWSTKKQIEIELLKKNALFRREFLGNVSHELKTPLFNIQGYIETLLDGAHADSSIRVKYLKKASKNVGRLEAIIEDLEFISSSENDMLNLKIESFNVSELILEVIESLELIAKESDINLKLKEGQDLSYIAVADREKISQVLINLITNSIKYGKPGGETVISCHVLDVNLLVEITDNGIGIDQVHLSRLFDRFYRVDSNRSREQGGTGLGLSIVKHIMEAHHQTVNVRSTVGEGSSFGFTLKKGDKSL